MNVEKANSQNWILPTDQWLPGLGGTEGVMIKGTAWGNLQGGGVIDHSCVRIAVVVTQLYYLSKLIELYTQKMNSEVWKLKNKLRKLYFQNLSQPRTNLKIQGPQVWGSFAGQSINFPSSWSSTDSRHTSPFLIYRYKERKPETK